ncbi:hypothetical protein ECBP1_0073 [Escherichia phage ECBP1]|uniref:Uncharacterized protein n=1 Tax=Escherichia phage ECBP1 TaxID=1604356 RepID=J9ST08_9CAUD|nr:tail protein [Escherichia phage ECBP1]AFR52024.1 hypothetical protein ECBP1_0073 [Escherichia phage ECBP1]
MNAHNPFDAKKDWSNPYCQNSSNDPMVDALLGNAYHVVRTVYCNLGNLKLLYDFLNQYGMVIGVQSEIELKSLPLKTKYARIYGRNRSNKRTITDYLYVDDDKSGIIPDDPAATGSWVQVSMTSSGSESTNTNTYIVVGYTSAGGETSIPVEFDTVGIPFITVGGFTQLNGKGFTYSTGDTEIKLAQELEEGDEVIMFLTGVPASPDTVAIDNWKVVNWLYNFGNAVGGEQVIDIPFAFIDVPAVYKNGARLYKGLPNKSYTVDAENKRIFLTEPLVTDDRVIITIGGNQEIIYVSDRTIQEVARGFNLRDSEIILDTDTVTYLNGKVVVYVASQQKSYKLPTLPTNVRIKSVVGDLLTYVPGNITVSLIPINII